MLISITCFKAAVTNIFILTMDRMDRMDRMFNVKAAARSDKPTNMITQLCNFSIF